MDANKIHFDSLAALGRYIVDTAPTWTSKNSSSDGRAHSWDLGSGWKGALELARTGWIDGAKGLATKLKAFNAAKRSPSHIRSFAGSRVHMPAAIANNPRCMVRRSDPADDGSKKVLRLIVQMAASFNTDANAMANLGTALARYVAEREAAGQRVEVIGATGVDNGNVKLRWTWIVKRASQPVNLPALAFSIGHPGMFRRLGFALIERSNSPQCPGYGSPLPFKLSELPCPTQGAILITGITNANKLAATPEKALEYLRGIIENPEA